MQTRSSVLGKRHTMTETTSLAGEVDLLPTALPPTPENSPSIKRFKSSSTIEDGDNNKENIPPLRVEALRTPTRRSRSLRRTNSEIITPSSTRSALPGRSVSVSRRPTTPATSVAPISPITPPSTPPSALLPICARARALLRPTANGITPLAGRDSERDQIVSFIKPFLDAPVDLKPRPDDRAILYISGTPGTGKTALVTAVLRDIRTKIEDAKVLTIVANCMALNSIDALWGRLIDELKHNYAKLTSELKQRKTKETPHEVLERLISRNVTKCIVVLDELDYIASSFSALASLFSFIHKHRAHVRLIGIANTHTLSSTVSADVVVGVDTVHFQPYTASQLLSILQTRLMPLSQHDNPGKDDAETKDKFLPLPTLTLLTKKIAAQTGDVRAVMEVLRGAIDIAVNSRTMRNGENPLAEATPPVTPAHVLSALKAYAPASGSLSAPPATLTATSRKTATCVNETVSKVRTLGLQARLALLSGLLAYKRTEAGLSFSGPSIVSVPATPRKSPNTGARSPSTNSAIDLSHLHSFYKTILTRTDNDGSAFAPVSRSEFGDLMNMLETVGLVSLSSNTGARSLGASPSKRRTASFGKVGGAGCGQNMLFVTGVRIEEIARGLGIGEHGENGKGDVQEEEVRAIWERELARTAREAKAHNREAALVDAFDDAQED